MRKMEENKMIFNAACEGCGAKFTCGAKDIEHCFCNKIILSEEVIEQIKQKYIRCLCDACLNKFATLGKS